MAQVKRIFENKELVARNQSPTIMSRFAHASSSESQNNDRCDLQKFSFIQRAGKGKLNTITKICELTFRRREGLFCNARNIIPAAQFL